MKTRNTIFQTDIDSLKKQNNEIEIQSKKILNSITSKIMHLINNNSDFKKNFIDIK